MVVFALIVLAAAAVWLIAGGFGEEDWRAVWLGIMVTFAALVLVCDTANAAWRGEFFTIASVTELEIGSAVELSCVADEGHPDWLMLAHPPAWQRWEAQVLTETAPGVYDLGNFPDMMSEIETNLDLWLVIDGFWVEATELPHIEFTNFDDNWPDLQPKVGHATMTYADGVWSIDSHTRILRIGMCGANPIFEQMTGDKIQVTWNPVANRFEGTATVVDLPSFCPNRKTQPYYCEVSQVRGQDYCAYLSEYDGRYEDLADRWRRYVTLYGFSEAEGELIFEWQLAKLEEHTASNQCKQSGNAATAPQTIFGQCEILQELIDINRGWSDRLAVWVPQYQRLGCPCKEDVDANGLPDYFDGECMEEAIVPETSQHDAYVIPVPEPRVVLLLAFGLAFLAYLNRRNGARGRHPTSPYNPL